MKRLLSLIGVTLIGVTTANSAVVATQSLDIQQKQAMVTVPNGFAYEDSLALKHDYDGLSETEKKVVDQELAQLANLNMANVHLFLNKSKVSFIEENKAIIENMFLLSSSFTKISSTLAVSVQTMEIDWMKINEFIDLDFGNSNNYAPTTSTYGPSNWWDFIWDWGWRIDFPEGDINIMRVVNLVTSLYNGINFEPLEKLVKTGKSFFDYLINLDQHEQDKIEVLYDLIIKTQEEFQNSGVPFSNQLYEILTKFSSLLKPFKNVKLQIVKSIIQNQIEKELGISLKTIGDSYSGYLNTITKVISIVNDVLVVIRGIIPGIIWDFIVESIQTISAQMIAADWTHNGVYLKFQQFLFPLGFQAK